MSGLQFDKSAWDAMDDLFADVLGPPLPKSPKRSSTDRRYVERCPDFPRPRSAEWHIYEKMDVVELISRNTDVVVAWLTRYASEQGFKMEPGPTLVIRVNAGKTGLVGIDGMEAFAQYVRRVERGVFYVRHKTVGEGVGHLLLGFVEREGDTPTIYYADVNGREYAMHNVHNRMMKMAFRQQLPDCKLKRMLAPHMNTSMSEFSHEMDEAYGLRGVRMPDGYCALWAHALFMDSMCTTSRVFTENHFFRLYDSVTRDRDARYRTTNYMVTQYLRAVATWLYERMRETPYRPDMKFLQSPAPALVVFKPGDFVKRYE